MTDDDPLLTPSEVGAVMRVDPKTVGRWADEKKIAVIRTPGGHRRFRRSVVRAILEAKESNAHTLALLLGLSDGERAYLAMHARYEAERQLDPRNYAAGPHPDGGQRLNGEWASRQVRHDRWREIADALHEREPRGDVSTP